MGFLNSYKTNKAVASILAATSASSPDAVRAILKIKQIGPATIPQLIESIPESENPEIIENLLAGFISDKSLPDYIEGLGSHNHKITSALTRLLSTSNLADPNKLLDYIDDPSISKNMLFDILKAQKDKINHNELLQKLGRVSTNIRSVLFQLLDLIANEGNLPDIIKFARHDDPGIRARISRTLSNFSSLETKDVLSSFLLDSNKHVRRAALEGIARLDIPVSASLICPLLDDPDIMVQSRAIETLININDPDTIKYLIDAMQNDSEYVRRAAVEVLNEIGDHRAVKDLLDALRDKDWWVRVRASDALGSIGGPKVVDAVLELIKDKDDFMRRTAIEILNTSKDNRAFNSLIEALEDDDWWVKERAADALAELGDKRAIAPLQALLTQEPQARQVAIRALAKLGSSEAIEPILGQLESNNDSVCKAALHALGKLTDDQHIEQVQDAVTQLFQQPNIELSDLARETISTINSRNNEKTELLGTAENTGGSGNNLQTPSFDLDKTNNLTTEYIDPEKLTPGIILSDRYRIISRIGRGAFGVIIQAEDLMVNEECILKFLNPQNTSDDTSLERFKHELRYARKVTQKNIIRTYDLLTFGNNYAISMEYFPSHSLADELVSKTPFEIKRGLNILNDICNGMSAAQAENVVHRDLKPANILINDKDVTKIADFGISAAASQSDSRLTKNGMLIGTPTYMAPEQAHGRTLDSRTDIYSLGIIMYEMFTGNPPYSGDYPMATLFMHVEGKAMPPREINPGIPEGLEKIITTAMAIEPDDRFQSFDEIRAKLNSVLKE